MDGDLAPLQDIIELAQKYEGHIIVDEAHSTGTVGEKGEGLSLSLGLESKIWARIYTFGQALGASGGALAISQNTKNYLINKSHPLIYSTAPMPLQALVCKHQLSFLKNNPDLVGRLQLKINFWNELIFQTNNQVSKNVSSPVQFFKVQGNKQALQLAKRLQDADFQIKAMLSPTVKEGTERIRISLHSYNTESQMRLLKGFLEEFENIFTQTF
jgi:8-amino-7-oxononanoate synthase